MDHCCAFSDAATFFVRRELARLQKEYPSKAQTVMDWLAMRTNLFEKTGVEGDDFLHACIWFFMTYVDDGGLACVNDNLYDSRGRQVDVIEHDECGNSRTVHQQRAQFFMDASRGVLKELGLQTPDEKWVPMTVRLTLLGGGFDVPSMRRFFPEEKKKLYGDEIREMRRDGRVVKYDVLIVDRSALNSIIHKLIHASDVTPFGKGHLFHLKAANNGAARQGHSEVYCGGKEIKELDWWEHQFDPKNDEPFDIPMAVRFDFPSSSDTTCISYADASREIEKKPEDSGLGAWSIVDGVFCYIFDTWTLDEILKYSINVLEMHTASCTSQCFIEHARKQGCEMTHSLSFTDNTTAEHVAERGSESTEGLHDVNESRKLWLYSMGVIQKSRRVASVDNDVADLLSRGAVAEALRFAEGMPTLRLHLPQQMRDTSHIAPTWPQARVE
jgi:hypothetical protein